MNTTEDRPVSVGQWIVTFIWLAIPVVNLIMLIVWAVSATTHPSKRTYARATLICGLFAFVVALVFALARAR